MHIRQTSLSLSLSLSLSRWILVAKSAQFALNSMHVHKATGSGAMRFDPSYRIIQRCFNTHTLTKCSRHFAFARLIRLDATGETLVVRHCALDSGTLTQDTELGE